MRRTRSEVPIVFISSTAEDLAPYRVAAKEAAIEAEFLPTMMEYFEARSDHPPLQVCLENVSEADVVVALVAHRYGWVPGAQPGNDSKSITWLECEQAVSESKEVLAFLVDETHASPVEQREEYRTTAALMAGQAVTPALVEEIQRNVSRLRDFKVWVNGRGIRRTFTTPEELRGKVAHALRAWRDRHPELARAARSLPSGQPASPDKYLRWLLARTAFIDIRGLQVGTGRAHRFAVEDLFVTLTAMPPSGGVRDRRDGGGTGTRATKPAEGTEALAEVSSRWEHHRAVPLQEALGERRLVILGDPGSGKTTFLHRIASALCRAHLGDDAQAAAVLGLAPAPFPLLVKVSELVEHIRHARAGAVERRPPLADSPEWLSHFLEATSAGNEAPLAAPPRSGTGSSAVRACCSWTASTRRPIAGRGSRSRAWWSTQPARSLTRGSWSPAGPALTRTRRCSTALRTRASSRWMMRRSRRSWNAGALRCTATARPKRTVIGQSSSMPCTRGQTSAAWRARR